MNTLELQNVKNILKGKIVVSEIDRCYIRPSEHRNTKYDVVIGLRHATVKFAEQYATYEEAERRYRFITNMIELETN